MELRTFRIPFARIMPPESAEITFSPDDYLVVRPLFARPTSEVRLLSERVAKLTADSPEAEADGVVLDLLRACVVEWQLGGPAGPIKQPETAKALNELPAVLRGALFPFLASYRGEGANPTTAA